MLIARRRVRAVELCAIGLWALSGCGSSGPTVPGPNSGPLPAATRAFVHVLRPPVRELEAASLSTFEVAVPGGQLRLLATRSILGASGATADLEGRFLYVAGATTERVEYHRVAGYFRSYSVDGPSGELKPGTQTLGPSLCCTTTPPTCRPVPLAAADQRLFVNPGCGDFFSGFLVFAVDRSNGELTRIFTGPALGDLDNESRWAVPRPSTPIVYADVDGREVGIFSSRADGRLDLLATVTPAGTTRWDYAGPYDAALTDGCLVTSWRNRRTGSDGITSFRIDSATGLLSEGDTLPGFVPLHMAGGAGGRVVLTTKATLLPVTLTVTCQIQSGEAVPISATSNDSYTGSLAFHPSGRYVYVDQDGGLQVYVVLAPGNLQLVETHEGVRGRVVVASPPS